MRRVIIKLKNCKMIILYPWLIEQRIISALIFLKKFAQSKKIGYRILTAEYQEYGQNSQPCACEDTAIKKINPNVPQNLF